MSILGYLFMLLAMIATAAVCDAVWVRHVRPILAPKYGWPDLEPEDLIPAWAWVGALIVLFLLFVVVPFVGAAAGF